jgi:hypothetical protein
LQKKVGDQSSYDRIAGLRKIDRGFSFQPNGKPDEHRLVAQADTFVSDPKKLQEAAEKFSVKCAVKPRGFVVLHGKDNAIIAAVEFAQQV